MMIRSTWDLSGEVFVGVLNSNHLLLRFLNARDYVKAWLRDQHVIKGIHFRVFPWSPFFKPGIESALTPVWISMPLLPLNFYGEEFLASIVSGAGRLLALDNATLMKTRPSFARVCVEVDLLKILPTEVDVFIGKSMIKQRLIYEKMPLFCSKCLIRSHATTVCPRMKSDGCERIANDGVGSLNNENGLVNAANKMGNVHKEVKPGSKKREEEKKENTKYWVKRTFYQKKKNRGFKASLHRTRWRWRRKRSLAKNTIVMNSAATLLAEGKEGRSHSINKEEG